MQSTSSKEKFVLLGARMYLETFNGVAKHFELRKVCVIGGSNVFGNVPWGMQSTSN